MHPGAEHPFEVRGPESAVVGISEELFRIVPVDEAVQKRRKEKNRGQEEDGGGEQSEKGLLGHGPGFTGAPTRSGLDRGTMTPAGRERARGKLRGFSRLSLGESFQPFDVRGFRCRTGRVRSIASVGGTW